jgi:MFS family permease
MLPATLAILSSTFQGRERASAFAAWGATAGVGAALGPVIGGFLTTNYSWRWSFGINVIIAPLAFLGAWMFMKPTTRGERQIIGEQVKLNHTPQQGWNSAKTPVSKRAAAATRGGR